MSATWSPEGVALRARGLVKRYGETTALAGVDVDLCSGESVAFVGPSGSGKSTLLLVLAGIIRPDEGEVRLFGDRIDQGNETERSRLRRKRFGFVFQSGQLLPELNAEENVALPLMLAGRRRRPAIEAARRWFEPLCLDGLGQRRPGQLSGGQAQRVAIARALVTNPAVVFADEPTGALDRRTSRDVIELLTSVTVDNGATLVVVTHDADIAGRCSRVCRVSDGTLDEAVTPNSGLGGAPS